MSRGKGRAPAFGGSWTSLDPPLSSWIQEVIDRQGFRNMTPVQAGVIPRAMKNQDCVVEAVTGSGKTLAFVLPILERICRREMKYKKGELAALVVAPTRELAQQIHDVFHLFLSSLIPPLVKLEGDDGQPVPSSSTSPPPFSQAPYPLPLLVTSGTQNPYETFLSQSSNIVIGTPGRLASFLLSPRGISIIRVSESDVLVLDEADRLLSAPDHRRDVERMMRHLPKQRRTHLFSATMTDAVEEMIGLGLRNPVRIVVNLKDKRVGEEPQERRVPTGLQNTYLTCRHAEKTLQLIRLLQREAQQNTAAKFIVYFSTCAAVDYFYRILSRLPQLSAYHLTSFHGDLPTRVRESALLTFTSHPSSHLSPAVLLCTDVAARGVDFVDMDVVIQYDCPTDPKSFSHRAGRTARAGRSGKAIVLLGKGREEEYIDFLKVRKIPLIPQAYLDKDLREIELPDSLDPAAIDLFSEIRKIILTDRELPDKSAKSFVSALRAYTKHEASFIFRVADLDMHSLAISYGLLRLPAMPEIKAWRKKQEIERSQRIKLLAEGQAMEEVEEIAWKDAEVDWDSFAYLAKNKEVARRAELVKNESRPPRSEQYDEMKKKRKIQAEIREAWSEQKDKKARKEDRRSRKDKKKRAEFEQMQAEGGEVGMVEAFKRSKAKVESVSGEGAEIDNEYKVLKKEVKEEKALRKNKKPEAEVGMFDGLD